MIKKMTSVVREEGGRMEGGGGGRGEEGRREGVLLVS